MLCATLNAFRKWTGEPTSKQMSVELEMKIELRKMRTLILFQFVCVCAAIAVLIFFFEMHKHFSCGIYLPDSDDYIKRKFRLLFHSIALSLLHLFHSFIHSYSLLCPCLNASFSSFSCHQLCSQLFGNRCY